MTAEEFIEEWRKENTTNKAVFSSYHIDCMEQYANERVKSELNSLGYFIQGADEDMISDRIERIIKELSKP